MSIDLASDDPFTLANEATLDELWAAVQAVESWTEDAAERLDHVYRVRVATLLRTQASTDELATWSGHLEWVTHPDLMEALEHLGKPYISRWRAFQDLLDDRLAVREYPVDDLLLQLPHVQDVLRRVADGRIRTDAELQQYVTGLEDDQISENLQALEQWELIRHCVAGGERCVTLGFRSADLPEGYLQDISTRLGIKPWTEESSDPSHESPQDDYRMKNILRFSRPENQKAA
ncbi:MAG: hypothetical protein HQL88_09830 [Magnetococcales bacterium]|nr:hypothetical protein [Magnetococcales bacterium]